MKKLILTLLTISAITSAQAQLEYYPDQSLQNTAYEAILKTIQEKIPQYQHYERTADPAWFEEYMINFQDELHFPGVSACFLRDGEIYWQLHNGLANINAALPVTHQTAYTVASISKTIMITAVMQLYEDQQFELDDDISDHLPFEVRNFHHPDAPITIKQLMTHTSSIQDNYVVLNDALHIGGDNPIPMDEFLEGYLLEGGAYFQMDNFYGYTPGNNYNYSNVGSCILAYMVEVKTGLDFETYCQQNVFGPLGMEGTSYLFENLDPSTLAIPYTIVGTNVNTTPQSSWPIYPIGNLKVSALQLAKHLGMNMNNGTFHDSILLETATVDLITQTHYSNNNIPVYMGLIWFIDPYPWFYSHTGRWYGFNTIYGYNRDANSGMIWLSNGDNYTLILETMEFWFNLTLYSNQYQPFSVETLTANDTDGDGIFEAGETIDLFPGIRNNVNVEELAENLTITITSGNPYIASITDPTAVIGDLLYLEAIQNPDDPISIQLTNPILPGSVELTITYQWGNNNQYQSTLDMYIGQAEVLLVNDENDNRGKIIPPENWYRQSLDSLGYNYQLYDLAQRGNPSTSLINSFPAVIWFTGYDTMNTITSENQTLLEDYLSNGGRLFMSGQNISDELAGTSFLEDYLHVAHTDDAWTGSKLIFGIENDPIGDGLAFVVGQGDGLNNQNSMSMIEPLEGASSVFTYVNGPEIAAVRYENDLYKTVFFGFGFEGINDYENRHEVMKRILNDYFNVIVGEPDHHVSASPVRSLAAQPNPVSGITTLSYYLERETPVCLSVYSLDGKHTTVLRKGIQARGGHEVQVDCSKWQAGVYICILESDSGENANLTKLIKR